MKQYLGAGHLIHLTIRNIIMEKQQILDQLRKLIKPHLEYQDEAVIASFKGDTNLLDELGLDSVDLVEVIIDIEDEFDIAIDDEGIQKVKTVNDLIALIEDKI